MNYTDDMIIQGKMNIGLTKSQALIKELFGLK